MKLYDLIFGVLETEPDTRNSDKQLIWRIWELELKTSPMEALDKNDFMKVSSTESIRRCRQKIQEMHPDLQATAPIVSARRKKASEKGTHVFREQTPAKKLTSDDFNWVNGVAIPK